MLTRLIEGEVLIADGAWGTMLFDRESLEPGEPTETLNLRNPDVVQEVAREYMDAGAQLLTTNTFAGSPIALARNGLQEKTEEINRTAASLLRDVAGEGVLVSGSIGPCGHLLQPLGDVHPDEVAEGFRRQISGLAEGGAQVLCVETMTDLSEALLAVRAAREAAPELPLMASMTFDATPRGFFTVMGVSAADAAKGLDEAGADVIGSNCGNGLEDMIEVVIELRRWTQRPLLIQSNAGLPTTRDGCIEYPEAPEYFAQRLPSLIEAGAQVIGGCCGTTPAHIRALKNRLGELSERS